MDIDEIVEAVSRKVMTKLSKPDLKILLVSSQTPVLFDGWAQKIRDRYSVQSIDVFWPGCGNTGRTDLSGVIDDSIRRLDSSQEVIDSFHSYEAIVIVSPCLKLMESIVALDDTEFIPYVILNSILYKKKTAVLFGWELDRHTGNSLTKKADQLLESLSELGIEIVRSATQSLNPKPGTEPADELITENRIVELSGHGVREIICKKGCIVTALAYDKARELGLKIKFES